MTVELFVNLGSTTVSSGGTTAPAAGTSETWTVASSSTFPSASNTASPPTFFVVQENDQSRQTENIKVTNVSGTTWTVTRGYDNSTPVAHPAGFTILQTIGASLMRRLAVGAGVLMEALIISGTASVKTNVMPPGMRVPYDCTLANVYLWCGTAPTGSALTIVVKRTTTGGTTTTIATASIAAGATTGTLTGESDALLKGEILTFDCTAVGSTVAGADVGLQIEAY